MKLKVTLGFCIALALALLLYLAKQASIRSMQGIPILMYHGIRNKNNRYSISPETFKKQLEKIYALGFVTARLNDVITKSPALQGKKVIILRFDDSRLDQFRYIEHGDGSVSLDPDCAVGVLLDFYREHPDFGCHALFCIIGQEIFHQPKFVKKKLEFLLDHGMEIANHSFTHTKLTYATPDNIDEYFGKTMELLEKLLGDRAQQVTILAPPYGAMPLSAASIKRMREFSWKGKTYRPLGILGAGRVYNHLCPLADSPQFDAYNLPSIVVTHTNFDTVYALLQKVTQRSASL